MLKSYGAFISESGIVLSHRSISLSEFCYYLFPVVIILWGIFECWVIVQSSKKKSNPPGELK